MRRLLLLALASALVAGCDDSPGGDAVTVALDFQPNAAHAAIYAADGLEVRVPSSSTDSLKLLAAGRADLAVVDIHDLGLARERGRDVVAVGALVQRPLAAVIAEAGVRRPRELEGRRVGVTGLPSDEAVLRAVVEGDGGDFERVRRVTIGFSAVPSLIAGRVDAVVAFWNVEGVALRERGIATREFRLGRYGAPRYPELVLATERPNLTRIGDELSVALARLAAGTRAALADRDATIGELAEASGADEALVSAQLEAVAPALRPAVRLRRRSLEGWAGFAARFGILKRRPEVDELFYPPRRWPARSP